jgi:hypothetical protein
MYASKQKDYRREFQGTQRTYKYQDSLRLHTWMITLHQLMTETTRLLGCEYCVRKLTLD